MIFQFKAKPAATTQATAAPTGGLTLGGGGLGGLKPAATTAQSTGLTLGGALSGGLKPATATTQAATGMSFEINYMYHKKVIYSNCY